MDSIDIYSSPEQLSDFRLYNILTVVSALYAVISISVLILSPVWPLSEYLPALMLLFPFLSTAHALTQRHLCSTVVLIHQYYAATIGLLYGILTVLCACFLLSVGWGSANNVIKVLFGALLCLGSAWVYIWSAILLLRIRGKSVFQIQGGGSFSILLLMRCACVPAISKKMVLYIPPSGLGVFLLIESLLTR